MNIVTEIKPNFKNDDKVKKFIKETSVVSVLGNYQEEPKINSSDGILRI